MVTGVRVAERLNSEPLAVTLRAAAGRCVQPSFVVYMFLLCLESQVHSCLMFTCTDVARDHHQISVLQNCVFSQCVCDSGGVNRSEI